MPMIDVTYPEGALSAEGRTELIQRLIKTVSGHEGVPDDDYTRLFTWCYLHELPAEAVLVGGEPVDQPVYRVAIAVPSGTAVHGPAPWASDRRMKIVREVTEIVLEAEGTTYSPREAWRVWVIMHEVADGFWGMAGRLFRYEDLVSYIAPDQVKTRVGERMREAADEALAARAGGAAAAL